MGAEAFKVITIISIFCSDSVALWGTHLPHHPSGTTSERTVFPEYREIGLAMILGNKKPIPDEGVGSLSPYCTSDTKAELKDFGFQTLNSSPSHTNQS
jgi:hypothetical protein